MARKRNDNLARRRLADSASRLHLRYWSERYGVTEREFRQAVEQFRRLMVRGAAHE